jgi:inner membrane protein
MKFALGKRVALVVLIGIGLMIPMAMIKGLIAERQSAQRGVLSDIAQSSTGEQSIMGPVLVVSYKRKVMQTQMVKDDKGIEREKKTEQVFEETQAFLPESLEIDGDVATFEKRRSIYTARLYTTPLKFKGRYVVPKGYCAKGGGTCEFSGARLAVGISDPRGIKNRPELQLGEQKVEFLSGANAPGLTAGIHAQLGALPDTQSHALDFEFGLELQGMERLWFVPTGKSTQVSLKSNWPHPSFYGRYLPEPKAAGEADPANGFAAKWRTSHFSTNLAALYDDCVSSPNKCAALAHNGFGVSLIQPADIYQQLERSAKYGFLFIGLTLIAFFLYEVLKRLAIHPVQYGLVGIALAMFYLLLTSLSEHISFDIAYAIASAACIGLLTFYVSYVLQSARRGLAFGALLGALYGALYVLLRSEDHSLMLGSVLLFALLTAVMVGTRKVDWYRVGEGLAPRNRNAVDSTPSAGAVSG